MAEKEIKHNRTRYNMDKCRCEVCTQANRDYAREWSRKKRGTFPGYRKPGHVK